VVSGKMGMGIGFYHGNGNGFMGMGGNGNRNSPSRTPLVSRPCRDCVKASAETVNHGS